MRTTGMCWDNTGTALGLPLDELLGGLVRDQVRVYAHGYRPDHVLRLHHDGWERRAPQALVD